MEVVIASSSVDTGVAVWDLLTGSEYFRFRSCSSPAHGLAAISNRLLASSQLRDSRSASSGSVHYWSWDKADVAQNSFPAEAIAPLASNSEGTYLVGGGASGAIYLWEILSGNLLKKWMAHFQSVTCLTFSDDESFLISGSRDGRVKVWNLITLFDDDWGRTEVKDPSPHSVHMHYAPVTDVICGYGLSNSIVISASEDHTCKVWSLSRGELLRSVTFPSIVNAIAVDRGEQAFYAAARDGKIYIAALNALCPSNSDHGMHIIGSLSEQSKSVNCLAFSSDGVTLLSGSEDGTVRAWDTRTRRVIRIFKPAKGPVNNVLVVKQKALLNSKDISNLCAPSSRKRTHLPIPPKLEKYCKTVGESNDTKLVTALPLSSDQHLEIDFRSYNVMKNQIEELQHQGSSGALEMESERLKHECKQTKQMIRHWEKLYEDLHKLYINEILDGRGDLCEAKQLP